MNLPCIQIKCLKYPACKNKQFISCTPLRKFCDELAQTYAEEGQDIWTRLYIDFPNLMCVPLDPDSNDSNIDNFRDLIMNKHKIPMEMIRMMTWEARKL